LNLHLFGSGLLFPDQGDHGYQAPYAFKDDKRPIGDKHRRITGQARPYNVKEDINFAFLVNVPEEIEQEGDQQKGYSQGTDNIREAHNQIVRI
jgi:hypothetical protein